MLQIMTFYNLSQPQTDCALKKTVANTRNLTLKIQIGV